MTDDADPTPSWFERWQWGALGALTDMRQTNRRWKVRRPWTAMVAILTAGHHGFELTSGVGLVWQPELGLGPASALWGAQIPLWVILAARGSRRWDRLLAVLSGTALAGVFVHFLLWPWHRNRLGIPVLTEAEGFEPKVLPAYNASVARLGRCLCALNPSRSSAWRPAVVARGTGGTATLAAFGPAPLLVVDATSPREPGLVE